MNPSAMTSNYQLTTEDYMTPPAPALQRFSSGSRSEHDLAPEAPKHRGSWDYDAQGEVDYFEGHIISAPASRTYGIRRTSKSLRK